VFAPVLDVHTNPDNPVIGDRSLATTPDAVARLGWAYAEGLMSAGVLPCGKHFPGHGDTDVDSHYALPTLPHDLDRLRQVEWPPFRHAVAQGLPSLMTAHVLFPALDPDWPATLSPRLLHDVLREEWGFEGVVCSDDLEMKGVAAHYSLEEIAVQGLKAGVDLFLLCHHWDELPRAWEAVEKAVLSGELSEERLLASYARVQKAKGRFCNSARPHHKAPDSLENWLSEQSEHREWASSLRRRWDEHKQTQSS
jgi:beta-N-acetylhexosaminidase